MSTIWCLGTAAASSHLLTILHHRLPVTVSTAPKLHPLAHAPICHCQLKVIGSTSTLSFHFLKPYQYFTSSINYQCSCSTPLTLCLLTLHSHATLHHFKSIINDKGGVSHFSCSFRCSQKSLRIAHWHPAIVPY